MWTGGGRLLKLRRRGSTVFAPFGPTNHSLPSGALPTNGSYPAGNPACSLAPSALSNTTAVIERLASAIHASTCSRATRTRPHGVSSHSEPPSSAITQWTESHGNPFLRFKLVTARFRT